MNRSIKIKFSGKKRLSIVASSLRMTDITKAYSTIDNKLNDDKFKQFVTNKPITINVNSFYLELILRYKQNTSENKKFFISIQEALYNSGSEFLNLI